MSLLRYVTDNTRAGLSMPDGPGIMSSDAKYRYSVWLGYDAVEEKRYVVIEKISRTDNRTKFFVSSMKVSRDEEDEGISHQKLEEIYKKTIKIKNRILARDLESKLKEISKTAA